MYLRTSFRRPSVDSILSNLSAHSTDLSSPCSPAAKTHTVVTIEDRGAPRPGPCCSDRSCESMSPEETRELWRCMLDLQERYGCYNSTRIDLAVAAGEQAVNLMPNRFIIDTLNSSVVNLPEEGWDMLNKYLGHQEHDIPAKKSKRSSIQYFWKRH
ncbi:hypothetical protein S40285_03951 [Stachybotrys chlorohalonatus IBT 40285]|uniref:Uncharacterized protein n=1 Tax=Stachybotrys chlorohalonatus (strain IBT 40285) TaxID=1283841 RepID=A0A084QKX7_STAC4|nr:hypothetical protein S40285_03951 [Stachybotrys chlorohalonata IBT 40285]